MTQNEFDRILMDDLAELPPTNSIVASANPWRSAMEKIMWGMALNTFKLEFFYLQYILPLLGAVLMYLGFRSLRKENKWFGLCWGITSFTLVWHAVWVVLSATPLSQAWDNSSLFWPMTTVLNLLSLARLVLLRAGIRIAFAATGEPKPKDWLGRGILAHLGAYAVAVWSTLVPLTEPSAFFGPQIMDEWRWLYYGRSIAFIALEIYLLVCISRQTNALAGRGYTITPAPVKCSARTVFLAVFAAVALALPPAMYLGSHVPMPEAQVFAFDLTEQQAQTRQKLVELGLPEGLADLLDGTELDTCAGAVAVYEPVYFSSYLKGSLSPTEHETFATQSFAGLETRISAWTVVLPDQTVRFYQWFEYTSLPEVRLQEQFSVDPSGSYPQDGYAARLVWAQDGTVYTCRPEVQLTGGQTADQLDEEALWWYEHELERLGHLHYSLWIDFSIPKNAETLQGYTAYTADISSHFEQEAEFGSGFYDFVHYAIRHQTGFLQYPYGDLSELGGHAGSYMNVPGESLYGTCQYSFDLPRSALP